jgi:DNA-binding response OmpR family regulator
MCTKILVIDDSPMIRQFVARSLKQHTDEYEIIGAHDGEQGSWRFPTSSFSISCFRD